MYSESPGFPIWSLPVSNFVLCTVRLEKVDRCPLQTVIVIWVILVSKMKGDILSVLKI